MFKKSALALTLAAALSFSATAMADTSIGVVNLRLVMFDAPQAHELQQTMVSEFQARQQELQSIETEGQKLAAQIQSGTLKGEQLTNAQRQVAQLQSDFSLKARALQEDQRKRAQELEGRVNSEVQKAINAVSKEKKLDLVLNGTAILTLNNEALNITDAVVENLKKNYKEGSIKNAPAAAAK